MGHRFAVGFGCVLAICSIITPADAQQVTRQRFAGGKQLLALTTVILNHHVSPPTRQELVLAGVRAVHRAMDRPTLPAVSRDISAIATVDSLTDYVERFLTGVRDDFQAADIVFAQGMVAMVPGGAKLVMPQELKIQSQLEANQYVGTGIVLGMNRDARRPVMTRVFFNGPAWQAGAKHGDWIMKINSEDTHKMTIADVVKRLRGEAGSVVEVALQQPESDELRTVEITRNVTFIPTVEGHRLIAEGEWEHVVEGTSDIGYVRINQIGSSTLFELRKLERKLAKRELSGIILDLRFGGGTLHDAVMLADAFLEKGKIGSLRNADTVQEFVAKPGSIFREQRLVTIVNRTAGSDRELIAAALQDNQRAGAVGEATSGQGVSRSTVEIPGVDIRLTLPTGELYRSSGKPLVWRNPGPHPRVEVPGGPPLPRRGGVKPNVQVPIDRRDEMRIMQAYSMAATKFGPPTDDPLIAAAVKYLQAYQVPSGEESASEAAPSLDTNDSADDASQ